MQGSSKQLLIAVALTFGGVLVFFGILALLGIDPDEHPLGLAEWVLGGILIAPGFRALIKWRRQREVRKKSGPLP